MERIRVAVRFSWIVAAFLLVATPAHPQSIPRLTGRAQGFWMTFRDRSVDTGLGRSDTHADFDPAAGAEAGLELRLSRFLGVDLGAATVPFHATVTNFINFGPVPIVTTYRTHLHLQPLTAGLDIHMRPGRAVDVYFGPTLSLVSFDGRGLEDTNAAGAVLGLDIAPGSGPWAFSASARYLQIPLRGQILDNRTHLDAAFLGAGVAYRF